MSSGQLRFSKGEDLLRTMSGSEKIHTPDVRPSAQNLRGCGWLWGPGMAMERQKKAIFMIFIYFLHLVDQIERVASAHVL